MNNKGSAVVEMCIIGPVLIFIVFAAIDILIEVMNRGIVQGEMYSALYNKENYISDNASGISWKADEENIVSDNLAQSIIFVNGLRVDLNIKENKNSFAEISNIAEAKNIKLKVAYSTRKYGIPYFTGDASERHSLYVCEEIRDTSNNLRRWQIYGEILSD
jgi:hypothetical protein